MYNAEVLSKFPVVQHFPFGSLFAWETDPDAALIQKSVHTSSQPKSSLDRSSTVPSSTSSTSAYASPRVQPHHVERTQATRAQPPLRDPMTGGTPSTSAPWASKTAAGPGVPSGPNQPTRAPWVGRTPAPPPPLPPGGGTMAPWATKKS
jgi:serine/threonine-protein phosphatase 2A activator